MATTRFKFDLTEVGDPVYSKRVRFACEKLGIDRNTFALIATKMAADMMMQAEESDSANNSKAEEISSPEGSTGEAYAPAEAAHSQAT